MKAFFKKYRRNIVAVVMTVLTALSMCNPTAVFAADTTNTVVDESLSANSIQPRSGTETLPIGIYLIGGFTFTNNNLTPVKTVEGSQISFSVSFKKAARDAGIGNVKLKFQVRDTYGNALSPVIEQVANTDGSPAFLTMDYINLGYSGRKIQLWMDASSTGQSNGNYRSIEVINWTSFVK